MLIAPLLTIDKTVWLNISTPSYDRFNHFNRMMKNANMKTLDIHLCCESCRGAGHRGVCKHRLSLLPPWSSNARRQLIAALYGEERKGQFYHEN